MVKSKVQTSPDLGTNHGNEDERRFSCVAKAAYYSKAIHEQGHQPEAKPVTKKSKHLTHQIFKGCSSIMQNKTMIMIFASKQAFGIFNNT